METSQKFRIHPLAAGAAVAVIIASAVAVAAMTGHLPGSNASPAAAQQLAVAPPAPVAPPPYVAPLPAVAPPPAVEPPPPPSVAQAAPAPACPNCGVVEAVNTYQQHPRTSTVGMIGGGVVGALVGNQFGHGTGNAIATVGGAAGGAYVGNEIGKRVEKTTRYRVVVRMDDGRSKTVTYAARPDFTVGSYVRVENGRLVHG